MKLLFICNQNQNRSKKAEEVFKEQFKTKSAGLFNAKPVNSSQVKWADLIVVMEKRHIEEIADRFPEEYPQKRILSLDIPDIYSYHDPNLVSILKLKFDEVVKPFIK